MVKQRIRKLARGIIVYGDIRNYTRAGKIAYLAVLCVFLTSVLVPTLMSIAESRRTKLNNQIASLLETPSETLAKKITYDPQKATYVFNKAEKRDESSAPLAALQQQVTAKNGAEKSLYSVDMPTDISKGFTYYDNNLGLSFKLQPQGLVGQGALSNNRLVYALSDGNKAIFTAKSNGIKEDVILTSPIDSDEYILRYDLKLPKTLEARMLEDGSLGIFSADPRLYGNITYGGDNDKAKVQSARETGAKDNLVFGIPAPVINEQGGVKSGTSAKFLLSSDGKVLSVVSTGLAKAQYPLSIDPSVVITSTNDFLTGNRDSNGIDFSSNTINAPLNTGGTIGTMTATSSMTNERALQDGVVYNGYLYAIGDWTNDRNSIEYAKINGDGSVGAWTKLTTPISLGYGFSAVAYNGYLYLTGGYIGSSYVNTTMYTKFNTDGSVTNVWTTSPNTFTTPRGFHKSYAHNGYIYISGGAAEEVNFDIITYNDIQFAKLNADGTIGTWSTTTSFTGTRAYHAIQIYDNRMYILGGQRYDNSPPLSNSVIIVNTSQYATINADGTIGTWSTEVAISFNAQIKRAVAYAGYMYMTSTAEIYRARILANGSLGTWAIAATIPDNGAACGLVEYQGYIYKYGGGASGNDVNTTYYGKIDKTGKTSSYTNSGQNDTSNRAGNASVAYNGYLYTSGGVNNDGALGSTVYLDDVRYAVINANGSIGAWQVTTSFNTGRYGHQMVAYNGYMYIMGGTSDPSTVYNTVQYAVINANGTLGAFAATTNLVNPTHSFGADAFNGRMYVVGGAGTGATAYTSSYYAVINANGTIAAWQTGTSILREARYAGFQLVGNRMYLSGGVSGNGATYNNQIQYATIQNDGSIGSWADSAATFSNARNGHRFLHFGGYFYIIGGTNGAGEGTRLGDVQYAPLLADGSIGTWSSNTSLPSNLAKGGGAVYKDYLYLVDGFDNGGAPSKATYYANIRNAGQGGQNAATWTASSSFTTGRRDHGYVAYNGYMYISGGVTAAAGGGATDVQYAPINADGSLGTWTATTSLNNPRYGHSMVAYNNVMYVVAGNVGGGAGTSVISAPINANGSLGTWTEANPINLNRRQHSTAIYNGYMYVIGGAINPSINSFRASVEYAKINANGSIGTWITAPVNFTGARGNLMGFVYGGYVYVMGGLNGLNNGNTLQDVQYAKINADGSVGSTWQVSSQLPFAAGAAGYAMYNGFVYIAGGLDTNAARVNTLQAANVMADGDIHDWEHIADGSASNFANRRDGLGLVAYRGYLYVLGGLGPSSAYYNDSQYMPIDSASSTSTYSKLVPFGTEADLQSISYTGSLHDGANDLKYALAPISGSLGSMKSSSNITPVTAGTFCVAAGTSQYIYLYATLKNDYMFTVFPAESGPRSNLQDITLDYSMSLIAPTNQRLFNGKWFYQESLQPYATCPS